MPRGNSGSSTVLLTDDHALAKTLSGGVGRPLFPQVVPGVIPTPGSTSGPVSAPLVSVAAHRSYAASNLQTVINRLIDRSMVSLQATIPLSGQRVVKWAVGLGLRYASSAAPSDLPLVLGLTLGAANPGEYVDLQRAGLLSESSWNWTPGNPVFLGSDGLLTQTVPSSPGSAFLLRVGNALAPTLIALDFGTPIVLAP